VQQKTQKKIQGKKSVLETLANSIKQSTQQRGRGKTKREREREREREYKNSNLRLLLCKDNPKKRKMGLECY
jgi:hypothetical protein